MTDHQDRLARALSVLCWGSAGLAQALDIRTDTPGKWLSGKSFIPPAVLAWVEAAAAAHSAFVTEYPPPKGPKRD